MYNTGIAQIFSQKLIDMKKNKKLSFQAETELAYEMES